MTNIMGTVTSTVMRKVTRQAMPVIRRSAPHLTPHVLTLRLPSC
jgi:hypothetical protein